MAANSSCRILGKQFVTQFLTRPPTRSALPALRRSVHASSYDKEVEHDVRPAVVPDGITHQQESGWAPNPHNGVFGPASNFNSGPSGDRATTANSGGSIESVLEVKTFFRSLEDLDKPQHP